MARTPPLAPRARAVHQVRAWIAELKPGDELPAERVIAERLGLARGTVRAALEELAATGTFAGEARKRRRVANAPAPLAGAVVIISGKEQPPDPLAPPSQDHWIRFAVADRLGATGRTVVLAEHALAGERWRGLRGAGAVGAIATYQQAEDPELAAAMIAAAAEGWRVAAHTEADQLPGCAVAASDHAAGGADLMRWLHARGRRRPLLFQRFPEDRPWMTARWRGARAAARALGLAEPPLVRTPDFVTDYTIPRQGYETNARRCAEYLKEPLAAGIDAILASTDEHGWQAAGACRLLGREPGRDVLITGYDHAGDSCPDRRFAPAGGLAATVDKDLPAISATLVELILAEGPARRVVAPHRIVELAP